MVNFRIKTKKNNLLRLKQMRNGPEARQQEKQEAAPAIKHFETTKNIFSTINDLQDSPSKDSTFDILRT